jgi:hypothetical protein
MKALPRGRRGEPCDLTAFRQWVEDPPRYVGIESRWDSSIGYCCMFSRSRWAVRQMFHTSAQCARTAFLSFLCYSATCR